MKKLGLLLLLFSGFAMTSSAQITINANDVNPIGQTLEQAYDTLPPLGISIGATGSNTWDFSGLTADGISTLVFSNANETPYANLFPGANIGVAQDASFYYYMSKNNARMELHGGIVLIDVDSFFTLRYTNPLTLINFPSAYNSNYTDVSVSVVQYPYDDPMVPADSIRSVSTSRIATSIDAYGMMRTPTGNFPVLRFKETEIITDTLYARLFGLWLEIQGSEPDTFVNYSWWTNANDLSFPLVQVDYDAELDIIFGVTWLRTAPSSVVDKDALIDFNLYPNPATQYIQIDFPETVNGSVLIYDYAMRLVNEYKVDNERTRIEVGNFPIGNYLALIKNEDGKVAGFKPFEIVR